MSSSLKIALADKSSIYRELIQKAIEEQGIGKIISSVSDGNKLVSSVLRTKTDLIITDTELNNLDGMTAISKIRKIKNSNSVYVFVISSLIEDYVIEHSYSLDIYYLSEKPCDINEIMSKIQKISGSTCKCSTTQKNLQGEQSSFQENVDIRILQWLTSLGIPSRVKGYAYLAQAVSMAVRDMDVLNCVTKSVYPVIADKFNTNDHNVERAIRNAIEIACQRGNLEALQDTFGYTISNKKSKPTNSECISVLAGRLKLES